MPDEPVRPAFLFGKLPTHGDFVARGLPAIERDRIDDWLSTSIVGAREALGEDFRERFDSAPPWRFVRRDDDGWTAGALVPSMDSAGRRFPVMVGRVALPANAVEPLAAACEDAFYEAFAGGWTADRLLAHVGDIAVAQDEAGEAEDDGWWTLGGENYPEARLPGARPPGLMLAMLTVRDVSEEGSG